LRDLESIVINLDRRPDRMTGCAARLQAYCPWLRFKKFSACDGRQTVFSEAEVSTSWCTARNVKFQIQRSIRKGWNDVNSYEVRELALSAGERGCSVSHIRAWRHCVEQAGSEQKPLLVLEDDAAPTPEFTSTLIRALAATPKDADVLYLGYSQAAAWRREVSPDLAEAEYVWTTVGYIIWPKAAKYLLSQLPIDQPVDNWMATACADGFIKAYCVRPKIIRQAEAWNVNSDVGHSDEHYWGPCSDIRHSGELDTSASTAIVESTDVSAAAYNADAEATMASADARFLHGGSLVWDLDSDDSDGSEDDR
jgi:GR25 family glycosyltransferase involved in LPS biosynthesis